MNKWSVLLDYDPKCTFYPKRTLKGKVYFYLRYYLPGGKRVSRAAGEKKIEARKLMFEKEQNLRNGIFDDFDLKRIPDSIKVSFQKPRILLVEALDRYMKATSYNRRQRTNKDTYGVLNNLISDLESKYIDEVSTEKVQRLVGMLQSKGLSKATILSYLSLLKTFFNWLIDDAEVLDGRNPVSKVRKPPRTSKIRDYLVKPDVVRDILRVTRLRDRIEIPIIDLCHFLVSTGARLGEVLHAEWQDFDLTKGIWRIVHKPECPTSEGLGWYPKWKKPRVIELIPEARLVLDNLPRYEETWGSYRDGNNVLWKRANFVFSVKRLVRDKGVTETRNVRISSVKRAWGNLLKEADVEPIQLRDLRTFFNWMLVSQYGLSHKEAGAYLGNSEAVNYNHYTPVSLETIGAKLRGLGDKKIISQLVA